MALRKHAFGMLVMAAMLATCIAASPGARQRWQQHKNEIAERDRAAFEKRLQPAELDAMAQLESRKHTHAEAPYGHHEPNYHHDSYHEPEHHGTPHYEQPHYEHQGYGGDNYYKAEHEPYGSGPADYGYGYYAPPSNGTVTDSSRTLFIRNFSPFGMAMPAFVGVFVEVFYEAGAQDDGVYGDWDALVLREIPVKATDRKFLTVSTTSTEIIVWGKLTDATQVVKTSDVGTITYKEFTFTETNGWVPDVFKVEASPEDCDYEYRCSASGFNTITGTIKVVHPTLGRVSLVELLGRDWYPKEPVQFVCELDSAPTAC